MNINILSGNGNSDLLMGLITDPDQTDVFINRENLSNTNREIYDNFFTEFGNHDCLNISNCEVDLEANRVTIDNVSHGTIELDYLLLGEDSKQIVDEFLILLQTAE